MLNKTIKYYKYLNMIEILQKSQKVSVYPSAQDLCTNENCIQSNFYVENYQNTDKYISFQINIVREDFLKPLRKSINNLKIKQMQNFLEEKYTSTIYQNVYILEEILLRNKLCTVLDLSSSPEFSRYCINIAIYIIISSIKFLFLF